MTIPEEVDYALLTDRAAPGVPGDFPVAESVVGPVLPDGSYGRFEPNPFFRPGTPDGPLDPFEAAARLWLAGDDSVDVAGLVDLLNETVLDVAAARGKRVLRTDTTSAPWPALGGAACTA